jgi:hypothetical protein
VTSRISPRALLAAAVVVLIGLVVLVQRPAGDTAPADPAPAASTQGATPTAPSGPETPEFTGEPAVATDAEFCAEFRGLEKLQGRYVAGDVDEDALRESAQALVDAGVPAGLSLSARSGYYTLIGGLYDFVGLGLDPAAVGAPDVPVAGGDEAFTAWLDQSCTRRGGAR